ncbi:MAG TPA: helix-turn-helix domain-containing protein, partial [Thermoanaerobaculia bacterium]|nr:helix-turn-helix domain-containing protein [Thermoanaerobaculia bacterium]
MSKRESVPPRKTDPPPPVDPTAEGANRRPRQPPWEKEAGTGAETGSFGAWLRRQREMREISLRDIADRTKISMRYLEAMEADRFELLPAPLFAKGFLREYARYVGLSPDDVVNHYLSVYNPEELVAEPKDDTLNRVRQRPKHLDAGQPPMRRNWSQGLILALAGLILLVLIALAAWFADRRREEPPATDQAPPMAAPAPSPAGVTTPPPPPPEPGAPLEVSLDFSDECWVDALIDGKTRRAETRIAGEAMQPQAQQSIALKLGNAGAVEVQVNGHP